MAQASLTKNRAQEIHPMIYGMDFGESDISIRKETQNPCPILAGAGIRSLKPRQRCGSGGSPFYPTTVTPGGGVSP